ncbi:hypothetical protein [Mesobacillus foraminis]|nr:hypothetical protein [Mesobacillus foraminis]
MHVNFTDQIQLASRITVIKSSKKLGVEDSNWRDEKDSANQNGIVFFVLL